MLILAIPFTLQSFYITVVSFSLSLKMLKMGICDFLGRSAYEPETRKSGSLHKFGDIEFSLHAAISPPACIKTQDTTWEWPHKKRGLHPLGKKEDRVGKCLMSVWWRFFWGNAKILGYWARWSDPVWHFLWPAVGPDLACWQRGYAVGSICLRAMTINTAISPSPNFWTYGMPFSLHIIHTPIFAI